MFEFIKGILSYKGSEYIVIDVGGVGFKIYTSYQTISTIGETNKNVTVYTYLNVKDDALTLFGFSSKEELSVFEMLISVTGVGPKVALSVLSALTSQAFGMAVVTNDYKAIAKSKGVGAKLAQRIVLELKDKIKKNMSINEIEEETQLNEYLTDNNIESDAVSALVVLGYSAKEAVHAVRKVYTDGMSLEETVKLALRNIK